MQQTPSDACGITLSSFMSLTHEERRDLLQVYHEAICVCHTVMMMSTMPPMSPAAFNDACDRYSHGNKVAANIAYNYLILGKDVKLPSVPVEWYQAVENAQSAQSTLLTLKALDTLMALNNKIALNANRAETT